MLAQRRGVELGMLLRRDPRSAAGQRQGGVQCEEG
jgi:hypothetical protein